MPTEGQRPPARVRAGGLAFSYTLASRWAKVSDRALTRGGQEIPVGRRSRTESLLGGGQKTLPNTERIRLSALRSLPLPQLL